MRASKLKGDGYEDGYMSGYKDGHIDGYKDALDDCKDSIDHNNYDDYNDGDHEPYHMEEDYD